MRRVSFGAVTVGVIALLILIVGFVLANGDDDEPTIAASPSPSATTPGTIITATASLGLAGGSPSPDSPVSATPIAIGRSVATPVPGAPGPSATPSLPGSDLPPLPAGTERVDAPIDGLEVLTLESFPPQYVLLVSAGLPSGCAKPAGYEGSRAGAVIQILVHNSMPTGQGACAAIYGMYELNIPLGSDFEPGATYVIEVNGQTVGFTAQ